MQVLAELTDAQLGFASSRAVPDIRYSLHKTARAVLLNTEGKMALQYLRHRGIYVLPGGGIDPTETPEHALMREVREEVGCPIRISHALGVVLEYRTQDARMLCSYGYVAAVDGPFADPVLDEKEVEQGLETVWITPDEGMNLLSNTKTPVYRYQYILAREHCFLETYLNPRSSQLAR